MLEEKIKEEIKKLTLKNAMDYGKAIPGPVISGIIAKFPNARKELKEISAHVNKEVGRVNKLTGSEITQEGLPYSEEFKTREAERAERTSKPNMELHGAEIHKFVTRFPPEPNGYMQIGHAKVAFLEREFADMLDGKINLYFDDTNPESERQEFVDAFKSDLKWLGISFDQEYYASDNVLIMYEKASALIAAGGAYVCDCNAEQISEGRNQSKPCRHRSSSIKENQDAWHSMLSKRPDSEAASAILRLKGDMESQNTAMRDPTLFRIKLQEHYRQGSKYYVWPTYDFNTPIMDSIKGITDAIRSKEYELRDEVYYTVLEKLGLRKPRLHSVARLEIENNVTSKRKINELIREGLILGYEDPRLVTIAALRHRGISPQAIKSFVLRFGMSKTNSKVSMEMLLAENRKLAEPKAARLFFVENPKKLTVKGIPETEQKIKIRVNPNEESGYREYRLNDTFFINTYDAIKLKTGDRVRLKDAFEIKAEGITKDGITGTYQQTETKGVQKLQWVNKGSFVKAKISIVGNLLKDGEFSKESLETKEGYLESYANALEEGTVVQFEGIGLFVLAKKDWMGFISL